MSEQSVREVDCADILDQFCDPQKRFKKINRKKDLDLDEDLMTKNICKRYIIVFVPSEEYIKLFF